MNRRDFISGLGVFCGTLATAGMFSLPELVAANETATVMAPAVSAGLAELNAITERLFIPKMVENFFAASPVLSMLEDKSLFLGGKTVVQPVVLDGDRAYFHKDENGGKIGASGAVFRWGQYYSCMSMRPEKSDGKIKILDMVRMEQIKADAGFRHLIGDHIYKGDPRGAGILGLAQAVDNGIEHDEYGEISRTKHRSWSGNIRIAGEHRPNLTLDDIKLCMEAATKDDERPNIILAGDDAWQQYYDLLTAPQRFKLGQSDFADRGFRTLAYRGIPVVNDSSCPTNRMYFLNTKYWDLYKHRDRWFKFNGWRRMPDGSLIGMILVWMILACSSPRMNSKLILGTI